MNKFCTNCGVKLEDNKKYCTYCGKTINTNKNTIKEKINNQSNNISFTKRIIAFILAITLGPIGAHNFYYGQVSKCLTKIVFLIISFGHLYIFLSIISIIEGILMLIGITKPNELFI